MLTELVFESIFVNKPTLLLLASVLGTTSIVIGCGQSGADLSSSTVSLQDPSSETVTLYFDGNPVSFGINDLAVALALFLNPNASTAQIRQVALDIFGLTLTDSQIVRAGPNPLANFDLNRDGIPGTIQDLGVAVAIFLGATTPDEVNDVCQDLLGQSCEVADGVALPGPEATPFPGVGSPSPTPAPSLPIEPTPLPTMSSIIVNTLSDNTNENELSKCSLRNAIETNNKGFPVGGCMGQGVIKFSSALEGGTIFLSGEDPLPIITEDLEIIGIGEKNLQIDAQQKYRIFDIEENSIVKISKLQLINGKAFDTKTSILDRGGAIRNRGELFIENVMISNNIATRGGGVFSTGNLFINMSTVTNNISTGGGGIFFGSFGSNDVKISVISSDISKNSAICGDGNSSVAGGGITIFAGSGEVTNTFISANFVKCDDNLFRKSAGGGIFISSDVNVFIKNTVIEDNTGRGSSGVYNFGSLEVIDSRIERNEYAGVENLGGIMKMFNSQVIGNGSGAVNSPNRSGSGGGGIVNNGTMVIEDTLISGNNGGLNFGGGVSNTGNATINASVISGNSANSGGGIENRIATTPGTKSLIIMKDTIVKNNLSNSDGGGLELFGGRADIFGGAFTGNTAARGGAISVSKGAILNLSSVNISNNSVGLSGLCSGILDRNFDDVRDSPDCDR